MLHGFEYEQVVEELRLERLARDFCKGKVPFSKGLLEEVRRRARCKQ